MEIRAIVRTTALILAIIAVSTTTAAALSCGGDICVNQSGWWRDGGTLNASGTPIQAAVGNATAGETIFVWNGSYTENVDIATVHLTLQGEGADVVTVTAANPDDSVFEVTADYVNISGFNVTGATGDVTAGIHLDSAAHCNISENNASNNEFGIYLLYSSNNTLTSNIADSNNRLGIWLGYSSNNTLTSNNANSNTYDGIDMWLSSNNTLASNNASNNNNVGISLYGSSNNKLTSNNASNNDYVGICLGSSSDYNTLANNTVSNNYRGIVLWLSSNNLIYNNYFDNTNNALDDGTNQWNITKTAGTNIIGGPFLGGNYWGDYAGNDADWDGLGDTLLPYNSSGDIQNGGDWHPLVIPDTTPPVITITTPVPYGLYTVSMELNFSATDDLSGVDTIGGNLTNTSGVSQNVDSGDFVSAVGVYSLVVTATDNASNTNVSDPVFFVVYDPDGGHATGGGWLYPDDESTLPDGRANFGFTARYKNDVSTGKLNFQYKDAGIHLKSTSIDWLTIGAVSVQFQGTGTINGEGLYTFRVQAKDNGEPGVDVDHFDIKIWDGTDTEADPHHKAKNTISGGNIQVHTK